MGPSLLRVVTQNVAECKVQQMGSSVVRHAGQTLGLKAQTIWQGVLVLHSSGKQGTASKGKDKAACEGMGEDGNREDGENNG